MIKSKLEKLLTLWESNNLITNHQVKNIMIFMKERQKKLFFSLLKWLTIIGTFWLVFGVISTVINLYEIDFFHKLFEKISVFFVTFFSFIAKYLLVPIYNNIINPCLNFIENIFKENTKFLYWGTFFLFCFIILTVFLKKIKNDNVENLNISEEQKYILKTSWIKDIIASLFLSGAFCCYNMLLIPTGKYISSDKIIPLWNILGAVIFITSAYNFKKNIYLIFGIYFVSLSVGMFNGYGNACYWISVTRPIIQIFIGIILLLIGYITQLTLELNKEEHKESFILEKFASTYNWTGLLLLFLALWVSSIWGFDLELEYKYNYELQLWFANILFIVTSVGAMYIGSKTQQKIYFNYGLVFLIIETYTIVCDKLWDTIPTGVVSLILGLLLIGTSKIIQKIYLKNINKEKQS